MYKIWNYIKFFFQKKKTIKQIQIERAFCGITVGKKVVDGKKFLLSSACASQGKKLENIINEAVSNYTYCGYHVSNEQRLALIKILSQFGSNVVKNLRTILTDGNLSELTAEGLQVGDKEDEFRLLSILSIILYNLDNQNTLPILDETYPIYSLLCAYYYERRPIQLEKLKYKDFIDDYNQINEFTIGHNVINNLMSNKIRDLMLLTYGENSEKDIEKIRKDYVCDGSVDVTTIRCYDLLIPLNEFLTKYNLHISDYVVPKFRIGDIVRTKVDNRFQFVSYQVVEYKDGKVVCEMYKSSNVSIKHFYEEELELVDEILSCE